MHLLMRMCNAEFVSCKSVFALVSGGSVIHHQNLFRNQGPSLDISCTATSEDEMC
jgi:hypothetical protein